MNTFSKNLLRISCGSLRQQTFKRAFLTHLKDSVSPISMITVRDTLKEIAGTSASFRKDRDETIYQYEMPTDQSSLPALSMSDSYLEAVIPLGSDIKIRQSYVNFHNHVRFGRIMEDLDSFGVLIGYEHNAFLRNDLGISPLSIVTASVDRINIQPLQLSAETDIVIRGHVSYSGASSMEVTMQIDQDSVTFLEAKFFMVARDPCNVKKAFICPLNVESDEERHLFKTGETKKQLRLAKNEASLLKSGPSEDERNLIHEMFISSLGSNKTSYNSAIKSEGSRWMKSTKLKNIAICFPEMRNVYNKVFGGYLMRTAFELGWINSYQYTKQTPTIVGVEDILFRKPVEIGALLYMTSGVVYTDDRYTQIRVLAEVVNVKTGGRETTNVFHYTFQHPELVPPVIADTYAEYMLYIDGKRHFDVNHL